MQNAASPFTTATVRDIERLSLRTRFSSFLAPQWYDAETTTYMTADSCDGYIWECRPVSFSTQRHIGAIDNLLSLRFPRGTIIQFMLFADPNLDPILEAYQRNKVRSGSSDLISKGLEVTSDFLRQGIKGMPNMLGTPVRNYRLFVSLKVKERLDKDLMTSFIEALNNGGFNPRHLPPGDLLHFMRQCTNGVFGTYNTDYDNDRSIADQIVQRDTVVDFSEPTAVVGKNHVACLTVPGMASRGGAGELTEIDSLSINALFGGWKGSSCDMDQISCPYLMTLNVITDDLSNNLSLKNRALLVQKITLWAFRSMRRRILESEWSEGRIAAKEPFLGIVPILILFSEDRDRIDSNVAKLMQTWRSVSQFVLQRESFLAPSMFLSALPFGLYNVGKNLDVMNRTLVWPVSAISVFAPVQADFRACQAPVMIGIGRKGQIQNIDLFDPSSTAYNFFVTAPSGSGKSFFLNNLLGSNYSAGAKVRILDVGGSYKKWCSVMGGRFLDFGKESPCINPLDIKGRHEEERDGELEFAIRIHGSMAFSMSKETPSETEWALITEACRYVVNNGLGASGTEGVIDFLADYPANSTNTTKNAKQLDALIEAAHRLAFFLHDFGKGIYAHLFVGESEFDIGQDDLVVVELEKLAKMPRLAPIVIMQMINLITADMYLGDRKVRRFILFEEVAKYIENGGQFDTDRFAAAINDAYRRARKYGASVGCVLQQASDLVAFGQLGTVISYNSPFKFFLNDGGDSYRKMKGKAIDYEGLAFELLDSTRNVKPRYSEVFADTPVGRGIVRIVVDRFQYWIATTEPSEIARFEELLRSGKTVLEALCECSGISV